MLQIKRTGASDYGRYIKALIAGNSGAGKTLLSSCFPNPIYASAEAGLMSIADRDIPFVEIKSLDDLLNLKRMLDQDPLVREQTLGFPVETVVIDTIDEVQRIIIRERLASQRRDATNLQDWGFIGSQMQAIVSGFRNLEMNVIFTVHLKEVNDGDSGQIWFNPGIQGEMGKQITGYVDLALLLKTNTVSELVDNKPVRKQVRVLTTVQSPQFPWVKDRSGKLPAEIPVNFEDDYDRIVSYIYGDVDLKDTVEINISDEALIKANGTTDDDIIKDAIKEEEVAVEIANRKKTMSSIAPESSEPEEEYPCDVDGCTEMVAKKQSELSKIRYRNVLCRDHYLEKAKK